MMSLEKLVVLNMSQHPMVREYLAKLSDTLSNRGVVDADEIYSSIEEHIRDALGSNPSDSTVSATLNQLGDIDTIIDDAEVSPPRAKKSRTGQRVAIATIVLSSIGLATLIFAPPVGISLALIGILVGCAHLFARLPYRRLALAGTAIGGFTLILAAVLAAFFLSANDEEQTRPETVIVEDDNLP